MDLKGKGTTWGFGKTHKKTMANYKWVVRRTEKETLMAVQKKKLFSQNAL